MIFVYLKRLLLKSSIMKVYFFTRKEIAEELRIDVKTFRRRLNEKGIFLEKGLIPAEKVKEIKIKLKVEPANMDINLNIL